MKVGMYCTSAVVFASRGVSLSRSQGSRVERLRGSVYRDVGGHGNAAESRSLIHKVSYADAHYVIIMKPSNECFYAHVMDV